MKYDPFVSLFFIVICLIEFKEHNKKVENTWPDHSNQQHSDMRLRFHIQPVSLSLLLIYTVIFFILDLISYIRNLL